MLSRFVDHGLILHCQIRTLPGRQWDVQNEFNRRLKDRLDALGIVMPYPARRVVVENLADTSDRSAAMRRSNGNKKSDREAERPSPSRKQDLAGRSQ